MTLGCLVVSLAAFAAEPPQATGWKKAGSHRDKYDMGVDRTTASSGKVSAFLRARADSPEDGFGTYMQSAAVGDYAGKRVRLSAAIKTQDVEHAALWLRIDKAEKTVGFDNMDDRHLKGTKDWARVFIVLDVPGDAERLAFGVLLGGNKGTVWFDDLRFEVVDKSVPVTAASAPNLGPANLDFEEAK